MEEKLYWMIVYNNDFNSVPEKPGVYMITCKCENGKEIVVYSGQSTNLCRRLKEHWSDNEVNLELRKAIKRYSYSLCVYYAVTSQYVLDGIEKYLFDLYKPQFQDRAPDTEAISCNFPLNIHRGTVNFIS